MTYEFNDWGWRNMDWKDGHVSKDDSSIPISVEQMIRNYRKATEVLTGYEIANLITWMKRTGRLE